MLEDALSIQKINGNGNEMMGRDVDNVDEDATQQQPILMEL